MQYLVNKRDFMLIGFGLFKHYNANAQKSFTNNSHSRLTLNTRRH